MPELIPIPAPVAVTSLDPLEADIAGGLILATPLTARATIAKLRADDFTHAALVAVVRAVDLTLRAEEPLSVVTVGNMAVTGGVVSLAHRVHLDALLLDLIAPAVTRGEPACWGYRLLIDRAVRRSVAAHAVRAQQVVESITDPGELVVALDALSADLVAAAGRMRLEVIA